MVSPDPRRGTLEVNWTASSSANSSSSAGTLKLEWRDRRTNAVVESLIVYPEDDCTYTRVETGAGRETDRVYLLQYGNASDRRFFFWMQEKEEGNQDEDHCVQINTFMSDPDEAAAVANGEPAGSGEKKAKENKGSGSASASGTSANANANASTNSGGLDSDTLMSIMQGLNSGGDSNNANASAVDGSAPQVDALSNILENLGMPQNSATSSTAPSDAAVTSTATLDSAAPSDAAVVAPAAAKPATGGLTLSDLQGAMAGLATTSPMAGRPGPSLSEVASPENIIASGILEDETVKAKLIELLPESQRSEERLMENLRSPQVQQCLKSLTAALCDDDGVGGSMDSFNSILANFQLRPEDGAIALASGNPIQAFLDCVLKSVQREKEEKSKEEDGDAEMKE